MKAATVWLDEIGASDERVAQEARLKLGGLTADDAWMTPQLLEALDAGDEDRRFWALTALSCLATNNALGEDAVTTLIRVALSDQAFANRQAALMALARSPAQADVIVPAVIEVVRTDSESWVRAEGVRTLSTLGKAATSAGGFLVAMLDDADASVAKYAAVALKFVPVSGPELIQSVVAAATAHRNPQVRSQLEAAVEMHGYKGRPSNSV